MKCPSNFIRTETGFIFKHCECNDKWAFDNETQIPFEDDNILEGEDWCETCGYYSWHYLSR
jgi:hypothetical protein